MDQDAQAQMEAIEAKLRSLELLRDELGAELVEQKQAILRQERARLEAQVGAVFAGPVNAQGDVVGGDKTVIQAETVHVYQDGKLARIPLKRDAALRRYLDNLIDSHQHLRLQGIRAGSQPLSVALEKVYVSLTVLDRQTVEASKTSRKMGAGKAALEEEMVMHGGALTVAAALKNYVCLVIIGDPGCGKTTLLSYLALTYARNLRDGEELVHRRLQLDEAGCLPVLLPLRDLGRHLREAYPDSSKDGPSLLLEYLRAYYAAQSIDLPEDFFAQPLEAGRAVILLDGMDEVAEKGLRQRVARLIEKFVVRYPGNRFVVTSREVGYKGAARLGVQFGLAKVRDFSPAEVRQFVFDWTRVVETTLAGRASADILRQADEQAGRLLAAVEGNPRIADLAVNPLLLTVVALVHRYRGQLPERRSELYEEAVEVLLGRWDEAKGLQGETVLAGRDLDAGDRRSLLEPVAFWMHEKRRREIERDELRELLLPSFCSLWNNDRLAAEKALESFLHLIAERSGLLVERGVGVFSFAHLTFQEYLAARALADRLEALDFTRAHLADPWWREVLLLQSGYLSTQGKRRVSELIRAIMDAGRQDEPEPHHHLLLAAECLFDVGEVRVEGDLLSEVRRRLKVEAEQPFKKGDRAQILGKLAAINALERIDRGQFTPRFWKPPWGEPEWVTIPAGEFWMGGEKYDDEKPLHKLSLPTYQIARTPVTNAQYALYVADCQAQLPAHWRGGQIPKGLENHPVVNVSWKDALAYCRWLSEKIGREVMLPSEAEWEKAARGGLDRREYPWGDDWEELRCNSSELGLQGTSPVGLFLRGASPYGVLDLSGNVWEWTRSLQRDYPYVPEDGREDLAASGARVLRGDSFGDNARLARCAYRLWSDLLGGGVRVGFRAVVRSPLPLDSGNSGSLGL